VVTRNVNRERICPIGKWVRDRATKARLRYNTYWSRSLKAMKNLFFREFLLHSLKAGDLDVHKAKLVKQGRPEAVLSAIHSCDVRLVVKSQSDLQIASSTSNYVTA